MERYSLKHLRITGSRLLTGLGRLVRLLIKYGPLQAVKTGLM
jgi:hypothetical protein